MAGVSAQDMLDKYLAAEMAVLEGKEITFNGRKQVILAGHRLPPP